MPQPSCLAPPPCLRMPRSGRPMRARPGRCRPRSPSRCRCAWRGRDGGFFSGSRPTCRSRGDGKNFGAMGQWQQTHGQEHVRPQHAPMMPSLSQPNPTTRSCSSSPPHWHTSTHTPRPHPTLQSRFPAAEAITSELGRLVASHASSPQVAIGNFHSRSFPGPHPLSTNSTHSYPVTPTTSTSP
jgi:hypothetical protein